MLRPCSAAGGTQRVPGTLVADGWPGGMFSPGFEASPGSKMASAGWRERGLVWLQVQALAVQAPDVSCLALTACLECCKRLLAER